MEVLIRFKGCMVQGFGFGVPRGEVLGFSRRTRHLKFVGFEALRVWG